MVFLTEERPRRFEEIIRDQSFLTLNGRLRVRSEQVVIVEIGDERVQIGRGWAVVAAVAIDVMNAARSGSDHAGAFHEPAAD